MPILDKEDKNMINKYKNYLEENKGHIMQSVEWGKLKYGWKNEIVYVEHNGKIEIAASFLLRKIPIINSYICYCPRGPITKLSDYEKFDLLIEEAKLLCSRYNIFMLRFDPCWKKIDFF